MTFKEWLQENLDEDQRRDLARFGAASGFPGLIYCSDTCKLYNEHKDELWELTNDIADGLGYENALDFLGSCHGANSVRSDTQFRNLMVWVAAEEYCRQGI